MELALQRFGPSGMASLLDFVGESVVSMLCVAGPTEPTLVLLFVLAMVPLLCLLSGLESEASKLRTLRIVAVRPRATLGVDCGECACMLLMKAVETGVNGVRKESSSN